MTFIVRKNKSSWNDMRMNDDRISIFVLTIPLGKIYFYKFSCFLFVCLFFSYDDAYKYV